MPRSALGVYTRWLLPAKDERLFVPAGRWKDELGSKKLGRKELEVHGSTKHLLTPNPSFCVSPHPFSIQRRFSPAWKGHKLLKTRNI